MTKEKSEKIFFDVLKACFLCCIPSDLQKVKLCVVKYNIGTLTNIMTFFTLAYLLAKAFFS